MKKTLLIIAVFLIASSTAFSQFSWGIGGVVGTKAGFDKDNSVYANLFGEHTLGFGLHVRAIYDLNKTFAIQGGLSYFLPAEIATAKWNKMILNIDFNYNFISEGDTKVYGLGGINLTSWILEKDDDTKGISKGLGFHFGVGARFTHFFIEGRYELERPINDPDGDLTQEGQIVATVGYIF